MMESTREDGETPKRMRQAVVGKTGRGGQVSQGASKCTHAMPITEAPAAEYLGGEVSQNTDRLLTPEETAALLQVTKVWLYRNAHRYTFTRKLSRKVLRFQESGVRRFIEKGRT
jgi:predicted DNA-binding transcriptional regulator AlpA